MEGPYPEPVAISALQHYQYRPRQYALIHIEHVFEENVYTLRGQADHKRVDAGQPERQPDGVRVLRALPLFHHELGLTGKADVVELLPDGTPFPVEFKHGRRQKHAPKSLADEVQLTAQALCLEYMFGKPVPAGAIFHVSSHKRRQVPLGERLRRLVEDTLSEIQRMRQGGALPPPVNDARCAHCSLRELCQPEAIHHLNQVPFSNWHLYR